MDRIHHLIQLEQSFQDRKQNLEDEFLDTKNHLIQEKEARIRELQSSLTEKNTYIEQEVKQRLKDRQITSSPPPFTLDEQEYSKRIIQALNR